MFTILQCSSAHFPVKKVVETIHSKSRVKGAKAVRQGLLWLLRINHGGHRDIHIHRCRLVTCGPKVQVGRSTVGCSNLLWCILGQRAHPKEIKIGVARSRGDPWNPTKGRTCTWNEQNCLKYPGFELVTFWANSWQQGTYKILKIVWAPWKQMKIPRLRRHKNKFTTNPASSSSPGPARANNMAPLGWPPETVSAPPVWKGATLRDF